MAGRGRRALAGRRRRLGAVSVREVDLDEAIRLRDAGSVVVDVRESFEWDAGHVAGARHIPLGQLADRMASDLPDKAAPLLLYCHSGARSGRAAQYLVANGYENVANLKALIDGWPGRGGAWEVAAADRPPSIARMPPRPDAARLTRARPSSRASCSSTRGVGLPNEACALLGGYAGSGPGDAPSILPGTGSPVRTDTRSIRPTSFGSCTRSRRPARTWSRSSTRIRRARRRPRRRIGARLGTRRSISSRADPAASASSRHGGSSGSTWSASPSSSETPWRLNGALSAQTAASRRLCAGRPSRARGSPGDRGSSGGRRSRC